MIIIIPIGGIGQRFKENGYKKPKALINIYGKPIISYLLDNLNVDDSFFNFLFKEKMIFYFLNKFSLILKIRKYMKLVI